VVRLSTRYPRRLAAALHKRSNAAKAAAAGHGADKTNPTKAETNSATEAETVANKKGVTGALSAEANKKIVLAYVDAFNRGDIDALTQLFIIKNEKIYRRWGARDNAAQMRQMGLPLA